ncbi:MAG: hypothetical protein HXX08_01125 [Chloroflexi bacterium]|uniref:Uncharacterized protein n=1 Tax=Candidatus Chlorohelix allophototropha TaxID=3003348 RepID=A0A8T7LR38_9CHLR|nr:hypothetical protein [Chloroflexota bacterium]WJW66349.1 hypothetical protein OZ401_002145 [Chloroflexota bacterium L227-S17]
MYESYGCTVCRSECGLGQTKRGINRVDVRYIEEWRPYRRTREQFGEILA